MKRLPYVTMGSLGALIGVNIASYILKLTSQLDYVPLNHIGEAVSILAVIGILEILLPRKYLHGNVMLIPIAIISGSIWEPLSFLAFGGGITSVMEILIPWLIYGIPTIMFIGFPIILISLEISREKKIMGIKTVGMNGLLFNAVICGVFAMAILIGMFHFGVFDIFKNIFGGW